MVTYCWEKGCTQILCVLSVTITGVSRTFHPSWANVRQKFMKAHCVRPGYPRCSYYHLRPSGFCYAVDWARFIPFLPLVSLWTANNQIAPYLWFHRATFAPPAWTFADEYRLVRTVVIVCRYLIVIFFFWCGNLANMNIIGPFRLLDLYPTTGDTMLLSLWLDFLKISWFTYGFCKELWWLRF